MRRHAAGLLLVGLAGCGSPTAPPPLPPPLPTHPVTVTVFYDEDSDGMLAPDEPGRVPGVALMIGGRSGVSDPITGRATIMGVPEGTHVVLPRPDSLPAFYQPVEGITVNVQSPQTEEAFVPLTLPIGGNVPHTYMAFGDSITVGDGSTDRQGYRGRLEARLEHHFGAASVIDEGLGGTRSRQGAERVVGRLRRVHPAFTVVHYGTNDWNEDECRRDFPCYTVDSIRHMLRSARAAESLPVLATIIPINVGYDARAPASRQEWVTRMNEEIKSLADEEGALLVDVNAAFMAEGDLSALFVDHVHPNDRGYEIMAVTIFEALASPPSMGTAATLFTSPSEVP